MLLNFRQGLVDSQRGITEFVEYAPKTNTVSLNTNKKPLVLNFAHGHSNYLVTIKTTFKVAWDNIPATAWLYWDIDLLTGEMAYGITELNAGFGPTFPSDPEIDTHFFNTTNFKMYVFDSGKWIEKIRLFAGVINNGVLNPSALGTQVGCHLPCSAGAIVLDHKQRVIRRFQPDGTFELITTETFNNFQHTNLTNHWFKGVQLRGKADTDMSKFLCVNWNSDSELKLADPSDENAAMAMLEVDADTDELVSIITHGFVRNTGWQWYDKQNTLLFLGQDGIVSTTVPQVGSIQNIGYVVNPLVIFLKFDKQIFINPMELSSSPTPTPSSTPSQTRTPSPTPTPTSTSTPSHTPSVTPTQTRSPTRTPTQTITPTFTPATTVSQTPAVTISPTPTITQTLTPSLTPSYTPSMTVTPTNTRTPAVTNTPTRTQTPTPSVTQTQAETPPVTQTNTPTVSNTPTNTITPTQTPTNTPSATQTGTVTPTVSNTPSPTPTPTNTNTPTHA